MVSHPPAGRVWPCLPGDRRIAKQRAETVELLEAWNWHSDTLLHLLTKASHRPRSGFKNWGNRLRLNRSTTPENQIIKFFSLHPKQRKESSWSVRFLNKRHWALGHMYFIVDSAPCLLVIYLCFLHRWNCQIDEVLPFARVLKGSHFYSTQLLQH